MAVCKSTRNIYRCIILCLIWLLFIGYVQNLDLNHVDEGVRQSTVYSGPPASHEPLEISTTPTKASIVKPTLSVEELSNEDTEGVQGIIDNSNDGGVLDDEEEEEPTKGEYIVEFEEKEKSLPVKTTPMSEKEVDSSGEAVTPTEESASWPHPFEIIYPTRLRRNIEYPGVDTRDYKDKHEDSHYDHVTVVFDMFGKSIKIKMSLNTELLADNFKLKQSLDAYNSVIEKTQVENCFYQGTVKKYDGSLVAVSTCYGMSGIIRLNNESYVIRPLSHHTNMSGQAHVVYKIKQAPHKSCGVDAGQWEPYQDLHKAEFLRTIKSAKYNQPHDLLSGETKYVEVALLCDQALYLSLNGSSHDAMMYMLEMANIVDSMYTALKIRLHVVLVEIWNVEDHFTLDPNPRQVLHNLIQHQSSVLKHSEPDVTLLLTGIDFRDDKLGLAVPDSICSERSVGVVSAGDPRYPSHAATGLAHMMAHTMGARHDHHKPCSCADHLDCVMDDSPLGHSPVPPQEFSDCSQKDLNGSLVAGLGACLTKSPNMASVRSYGQKCGNGVVERGEECDCGSEQNCALSDPCCDAATCLLKPWATCRHGDCCHNCTVATPKHMCRAPASVCDVPEFCTGQSGECPSDALFQDGELCGGDSSTASYCYQGQCHSFNDQCQALWGKSSHPSDFHCYQNFNPSGHFNGHCGINKTTGQYIKCQLEDIKCGLLHCQGGVDSPEIAGGPHITYSSTKTVSSGKEYECKIVTGELPDQRVGLVEDGSPCAIGGLCVKGHCTPITTITPVTCTLGENNLPCSGKGVCTTKLECFCHSGYEGLACEKRMTTAPSTPSPPSTATTPLPTVTDYTTLGEPLYIDEDDSVQISKKGGLNGDTFIWLMIVLGGVAGSSCVLLLFCMLCYRRRSPHQLLAPGEKKLQKKKILGSRIMMTDMNFKYETSSDGGGSVIANRAISFGKMPSYRADKMKKALRKSIGDASETGSEHSAGGGLRGSRELPITTQLPHTLPTPPARGILKKREANRRSRSLEHQQRRKSVENSAVQYRAVETDPLKGLITKGPLPNSPVPWLKAMPDRPLPPLPDDPDQDYLLRRDRSSSPDRRDDYEGDDGDEGSVEGSVSVCDSNCPSQCSCDSIDKKSLSDFDDDGDGGEYSDEEKDTSHDAETQTDNLLESASAASAPTPQRGMPRDLSSDSLGETKNKILKLKNINDLLRQIDEQFSSVLRQTAAANDFTSPTTSDESPLSDEERQKHQRLSSIMSSPEPLPSPSCIVSPISHQPQSPGNDLGDDNTLPIRRGFGIEGFNRQYNMDPLNILSSPQARGRRSSTPKENNRSTSPEPPKNQNHHRSTSPIPRRPSNASSSHSSINNHQPLTINTSASVPAVPYRGSFRASPNSGSSSPAARTSSPNSPRSPHSPSPARPTTARLPIKHPHRPAGPSARTPSPQSPDVSQAARLTHPLLDGYPFKRAAPSVSQSQSQAAASDFERAKGSKESLLKERSNVQKSDAAAASSKRERGKSPPTKGAPTEAAPTHIVREIPKKPTVLHFPAEEEEEEERDELEEILSSPENINV